MTIDGVKCDRGIIDACETAVKAKGDGRVSKEDAEKVFVEGLWRVEEVFFRSFMKTEKHFLGGGFVGFWVFECVICGFICSVCVVLWVCVFVGGFVGLWVVARGRSFLRGALARKFWRFLGLWVSRFVGVCGLWVFVCVRCGFWC